MVTELPIVSNENLYKRGEKVETQGQQPFTDAIIGILMIGQFVNVGFHLFALEGTGEMQYSKHHRHNTI